MNPSILLFGREVATYTLLSILGVLAAFIFVLYVAKREKQNPHEVVPMFLFIVIGVLLGGPMLYALVNVDIFVFMINELRRYGEVSIFLHGLARLFGGQVFFGGLYGGILSLYLYLRATKQNTAYYFWLLTPGIPLFHTFGRMGCFFAGCCYGVPLPGSSVALFMNGGNVARVPTQLIEVCFNLLLFLLLFILQNKKSLEPHLFRLYLTSYAVLRFILEFFRGDEVRGVYGFLSTSQIVSLLTVFAVAASYLYGHLKKENTM